MRCVVQRVKGASVSVNDEQVGRCGQGFLVLLGVHVDDTEKDLDYMARKVPSLRIFEDEEGKMNRSLKDIGGEILCVSQFTLYGDARGGNRPAFITAARRDKAEPMYQELMERWRQQGIHVEAGIFGADMQVSLINDGPVTILLDSTRLF